MREILIEAMNTIAIEVIEGYAGIEVFDVRGEDLRLKVEEGALGDLYNLLKEYYKEE